MAEYENKGECPKCGDKSHPFVVHIPEGLFAVCKTCRKIFRVQGNNKLLEADDSVLPEELRQLLQYLVSRDQPSVAG